MKRSFAVAKDAAGSGCEVEGEVVSLEVDPETVAHFESEATEGAPIPEHSATDRTYEMVASTVRIHR